MIWVVDTPLVFVSVIAFPALEPHFFFQRPTPGKQDAPVGMEWLPLHQESHIAPRWVIDDFLHVRGELGALVAFLVLDQEDGVVEAPSNVDDLLVMEGQDHLGELLVFSVPMPQLPMVAPPKCVHMTTLAQRYRVVAPTSYLGDGSLLGDVLDVLREHRLFLLGGVHLVLVPSRGHHIDCEEFTDLFGLDQSLEVCVDA